MHINEECVVFKEIRLGIFNPKLRGYLIITLLLIIFNFIIKIVSFASGSFSVTYKFEHLWDNEIDNLFRENLNRERFFGWTAMGNDKPGSGIDLAIMGNITDELVAAIAIELNQHLSWPYKFDVVGYELIENQDLKRHIDQFGERLLK